MAFEFTLSETKTVSCTKGVEWNFNVAVGLEVGVEFPVPFKPTVKGTVEVKLNLPKSNERSEFRWQEKNQFPILTSSCRFLL